MTMNSADVMKMAQTKSLVLLAGPCVVEGEDDNNAATADTLFS